MKVCFAYPIQGFFRTQFYEALCDALRRQAGLTDKAEAADLLFPCEDAALETNWPRYARASSAFIRGAMDKKAHRRYLRLLALSPRPLCVVNMHPFIRVPLMMAQNSRIVVADINLLTSERALNPRTISMPALPITIGHFDPAAKNKLVSFRGVNSHPVREALAALKDSPGFDCSLVDPANHCGKIDAGANQIDQNYFTLLNESIFALVPRGDAHFSYRLLEVLSFGCIPVILADDLILPFDRVIPWDEMSLHVLEKDVPNLPELLSRISPEDIARMQRKVVQIYQDYLSGFDVIAQTLMREIEILRAENKIAHATVPTSALAARLALGAWQIRLGQKWRGFWVRKGA